MRRFWDGKGERSRMKQARTRICSLLLALVMCLSLLPVTALAAEEEWDPNGPFTVTFDANGGTFRGGGTVSVGVTYAKNPNEPAIYVKDPPTPVRDGYRFVQWDIERYQGRTITECQFTNHATVKAEWEETSNYSIAFDANGGVFSDGNTTMLIETNWMGAGNNLTKTPEEPVRPGFAFDGWTIGSEKIEAIWNYDFTSDTTVRAAWKTAAELYITFDPNGGTCDVKTLPLVGGTLTGTLPTPVRKGYKFLGWFRTTTNTQVQPGEAFTAPETVVAKWTQEGYVEPVRVDFFANGGRLTQLDGNQIPSLTAGSPPVYFGDGSGRTGVDSNSGIGWTETKTDGRLNSLPKAERSGYTFDGWYLLKDDSSFWTQVGSNYDKEVFTNFAGLEKLTASTVITASGTFVAKWTKAGDTCTVTFHLNGASGTAPDPVKVEKGKSISNLPVIAAAGARFMGWGFSTDGKTLQAWKEDYTVPGDLTLYAMWEYDRLSFLNSELKFFKSVRPSNNYAITGKYLTTLRNSLSDEDWPAVSQLMMSSWEGSCYGMSAVHCLRYVDRIDPAKVQSGASSLYDLKAPASSQEVFNLVNYYFLQQRTPWGSTAFYPKRYVEGEYNKQLVNTMSGTSNPVLISFIYGPKYFTEAEIWDDAVTKHGHAIVGMKGEKNADGSYTITVWDPNQEKLDELTISKDYRTASFASRSYSCPMVNCVQSADQCRTTFDRYNIQNVTSSSGTNVKMNTFHTTLKNYTVTDAKGNTAVFQNGVPVSGGLDIAMRSVVRGDGELISELILPDSASYTIAAAADTAGTAALRLGESYVELDSKGVKELTVTSSGQVSVSSDRSAAQTVSVTSSRLGSTWDCVTVSGTDTGLTVDIGKESAKVSSRNGVAVSVTGSNVFTEKKSAAQSVTASAAGTAVTMSSLGGTAAAQPAGANPFTDVSNSAYYYDAVLWAVEKGVTGGTTATTFSPNNPCTRAQIVTFLWRAAGSPKPASSANPFTDVKAGAYYYDAVLWAVEKGITGGTTATTFSPNSACTRGQTVTFLWRSAGSPKSTGTNPFTDVSNSAYYYDAVLWAVEKGVTSGVTATTFGPGATVTRGQTVTFLYRSQGK